MSRLIVRYLFSITVLLFAAACSLTSNPVTPEPTDVIPPTSVPNTVSVIPTRTIEATQEVVAVTPTADTTTPSNSSQSTNPTNTGTTGGTNTTIGTSSGGQSNTSGGVLQPAQPSITQLTYSVTGGSLEANALNSRTARVRLTWQVVNRPANSNLVFEQILSDGTVVNVELPRTVSIVPSSGSGDVAPVLPGSNANSITLRLRVVDLSSSGTLASRVLTVPVIGYDRLNTSPTINAFTTQQTTVDRQRLSQRTERVTVRWEVLNRPPNANLVFEQVLPNGIAVNIELPRDVSIVPSSGSGDVVPYLPDDTATTIQIQVRLVDVVSGSTYTSSQLTLAVTGTPNNTGIIIYDPSECLSTPFMVGNGIAVGAQARVVRGQNSRTTINLMALVNNAPVLVDQVSVGTVVNVIGGPFCYRLPFVSNNQLEYRMWQIRTPDGREGWVYDYFRGIVESGYHIAPVTSSGDVVVTNLTVTPDNPAYDATVTVRWEVTGNATVHVTFGTADYADMPLAGSLSLPANNVMRPSGEIFVAVNAIHRNNSQIGDSETRTITVQRPTNAGRITSATVTPNAATPGSTVTVSWTTQNATRIGLSWIPDPSRGTLSLLPNTDNLPLNGSYVATIPANAIAGRTIRFLVAAEDAYGFTALQYADVDIVAGGGSSDVTFEAAPNPAQTNSDVTVRWNVSGATTVNISYNPPGANQFVSLVTGGAASGQRTVTMAHVTTPVEFRLFAFTNNTQIATRTVTVNLTCQYTFFVSDPSRQGSDCAAPLQETAAAYQQFQGGFMVWMQDRDEIIVYYNDGRFSRFTDTWGGEDITYSDNPPAGLLLPVRGFGRIWVDNALVRERLGWASAAEQSYTAQRQRVDNRDGSGQIIGNFYLSLPDGRAVYYSSSNTGNWVQVR